MSTNVIHSTLDPQAPSSEVPCTQASATLTPRQQREREFYDQYSQKDCFDTRVILDPITSPEHRPWNCYWHTYRTVRDRFHPGARLLDFGCGWGTNSILFAKIGYQVDGFDISPGNLDVARRLAHEHDVESLCTFTQHGAEQLPYPDETFDVVAGIDILHHVDIPRAIRECRRVLKTGGVAVFREPIHSWVFDSLRNTWLARKLVPNSPSFERHITADERKLFRAELKEIRRVFPNAHADRFRVFSRLGVLIRSWSMGLEKLDYHLRWLPGFNFLSGTAVFILEKKS